MKNTHIKNKMAVKKLKKNLKPNIFFFCYVVISSLFYLTKEKTMAFITLNQLYMGNFKYRFLGNGFNCDLIIA